MKEMNNKNKLKAIVAFAVALAFMVPTSAVFVNDDVMLEDTTVSIDPAAQTVDKETSFTVDVYVVPSEPISGVQFDLFFDETIIHAVSVVFPPGYIFEGHDVTKNPGIINNVNGEIMGVYCSVNDWLPLPTEPGVFVTISFTSLVKSGTSLLDLGGIIKVMDYEGDAVTIIVNDGSVTVADFYDLDISHTGDGVTDPDTGTYIHASGAEVPLFADPDDGWSFGGWSGSITDPNPSTTVTMDSDKTVLATFTWDEYTLTVLIDDSNAEAAGGYVDVDPLEPYYRYDDTVELLAVEADGWTFTSWSGGLTGNPTTIVMDESKTVTATFTEDIYTLTVHIAPEDAELDGCYVDIGGAIPPYKYNDVVTLTPVPETSEGWIFSAWTGDVVSNEIIMTEDKEVTATFMQEWIVEMTIAGNIDAPSLDLMKDYVFFGEAVEANDDKDDIDLPYPGTPPDPYVAAWFKSNFEDPDPAYDTLEKDIRSYPEENRNAKIWDLWVKVDTAGNGDTVAIKMSWNTSDLAGCEFDYVGLYDALSGDLLADMISVGTFWITVPDGLAQHFHIIAGWTLDFDIERGWNLISMPAYEENFDKTNLIVEHGGYYRTWDQAIANDWILGYTYGWEAGAYANYNDLTRGDGYWMWAYTDCRIIVPSVAVPENHITTFDDGEGWYLVGAPYTDDKTKEQVQIQYNAQYYTWDDAVDDKIILPYLYDWNRDAPQNYELSDGFDSGYGYWMYVYEPCSLKKL